jgi:hypothetical protein
MLRTRGRHLIYFDGTLHCRYQDDNSHEQYSIKISWARSKCPGIRSGRYKISVGNAQFVCLMAISTRTCCSPYFFCKFTTEQFVVVVVLSNIFQRRIQDFEIGGCGVKI